jgi:hypothetical protein
MKKLPVYKINIDDVQAGVQKVSLVDLPAIQVNWFAFNKVQEMSFKADSDKQKLAGPFLIPDFPIYRFDAELGEYYVVFSKEVIEQISEKFNKESRTQEVNSNHSTDVESAFISENWLIENENDKSKKFGFDLPIGTWFGVVKIEDKDFWDNQIKTGELKGFSVEGLLGLDFKINNNKNNMKKNKKEKFAELPLANGNIISISGELAVGTEVYVVDAEGNEIPAPDGEHTLESGEIIIVAEGKITEVIVPEEEVELDNHEPTITNEEVIAIVEPIIEELRGVIAGLMTRIEELESKMVTSETVTTELKGQVEKFSLIPANKSVSLSNQPIQNKTSINKNVERILKFKNIK